jgi:peptidoglycan hydrolase-like protein with peptidoglycan-binding domain
MISCETAAETCLTLSIIGAGSESEGSTHPSLDDEEGDPRMPATLNPWPTTRQGSTDHPVQTLQYLLLAHGHTVTVDGVFGSETGDAVRAVQRAKNLPDNGVVDAATWHALLVPVRPGMRGSAVRGLQEEFALDGADGIYGPKTEAAIRDLQRTIRSGGAPIEIDGVVGPQTWQALVSGLREAAPLSKAA